MKKITLYLLLSLTLMVSQVSAQVAPNTAQQQKCAALQPLSPQWYSAGCNLSTQTAPGQTTTLFPGTVGGGALPSGALDTSSPYTPTVAASPQSSSVDLSQCSKIQFDSIFNILTWIKCIITVGVIPLIFAAAFVFFLWGVLRFIATSDPAKKEAGKKFIIAGLIGLFVMTSLWGIIKIVGTTLGVDSVVPLLQTSSPKQTP